MMVLMVVMELTVYPESPVLRVPREMMDPLGPLDDKENPDPMELLVYPELTDSPDSMEIREPRESEEIRVPPESESPEMMVFLVPMVPRELREKWECLEPLD